MSSWHAIGLFCEDIREENRSVLGIFADNLLLPTLPATLARMGMYVRVNVPSDTIPQRISVAIGNPDGDNELMHIDLEAVKDALEGSKKNELSLAGFILTAIASPMTFNKPGQLYLVARYGDEEMICGNLRIVLPSPSTSSNNSPQPSSQSQPASPQT